MFIFCRLICEGDPLAVRRPTDKTEVEKCEVNPRHSGGAQFSFWAAKRGNNVDTRVGPSQAMKRDLRAVRRPPWTNPIGGMLRKAEKSFASKSLHIQVEPL